MELSIKPNWYSWTRNKLEKKFGYEVRDKLRGKILNKVVKVKCGEFDKYGRLLTEIYFEDENVNQWLIDSNYAFEYDGGTKKLGRFFKQ